MKLGVVYNKRFSDHVSGFIVRDVKGNGDFYFRWYINGESGVERLFEVARGEVVDRAKQLDRLARLVG